MSSVNKITIRNGTYVGGTHYTISNNPNKRREKISQVARYL